MILRGNSLRNVILVMAFLLPCGGLMAQLEVTDPASGAYVSGEYEVRITTDRPQDVASTIFFRRENGFFYFWLGAQSPPGLW